MNKEYSNEETGGEVSKREKLKEFYFDIRECTKCDLSKTRTNFVFGSGNPDSKVILVGEAPGKNEDLQGKPFVGQAGMLLDELLGSIGFTRNNVFIANVLKCRPPSNRDPLINEINTCKHYLFKQIEIINPLVVCTMGRYSTQLILDSQEGISSLRGNVYKKDGRIIMPINHPAAALYTRSRMQILKEDFKRLKAMLESILNEEKFPEINGIKVLKDNEIKNNEIKHTDDINSVIKRSVPEDKEAVGENRQLGLF